MEEIETLQDLDDWIGEQRSQIAENNGRWSYSRYCNVINETHEHVLSLCKQHLQLIPKRQALACVSEERTAALRDDTLEGLQILRDAVDPQKNKGGRPKKNEGVYKLMLEYEKEDPRPTDPEMAKRLCKRFAGHHKFTERDISQIRYEYNGGRKSSKQNHKKGRRKTRRKTQ